jgi:hypothetical protein
MDKQIKYVIVYLLVAFVVAFHSYLMNRDIKDLQRRVDAMQIEIDDLNMHSKTPCLTIPDGSPCQDKTVFFRLPGGSLRKEIRRICVWKSPLAQIWKEDE